MPQVPFKVETLSLDNGTEILNLSGSLDPSTGVGQEAPVGSIYTRVVGTTITSYEKTSTAITGWTVKGLGPTGPQGTSGGQFNYKGSKPTKADIDLLLATIGTNVTTFNSYALSLSPQAFYDFQETTGAVIDLSGNANHGTYVGGVTLDQAGLDVNDSNDKSVLLDGSTGYLNLGASQLSTLQGSYTALALFEIKSIKDQKVFTFSNSTELEEDNILLYLRIKDSNTIQIAHEYGVGNNELKDITYSVLPNVTYLAALTKDKVSKTYTLYMNGVIAGVFNYTNEYTGGANGVLTVGSDTGNFYLDGFVSKTLILNKALTEEEILTLYALSRIPKANYKSYKDTILASGPELYLPFDDGINDISGNNHPITQVGNVTLNEPSLLGNGQGKSITMPDEVGENRISTPYFDLNNKTFTGTIKKKPGANVKLIGTGQSNVSYPNFAIDVSSKVSVRIYASNGSTYTALESALDIQDNVEYQIAVEYINTGLKLYINGKLDSSLLTNIVSWNVGGEISIGGDWDWSTGNNYSSIDEVAIFNSALSADTILKQYIASKIDLTSIGTVPVSSTSLNDAWKSLEDDHLYIAEGTPLVYVDKGPFGSKGAQGIPGTQGSTGAQGVPGTQVQLDQVNDQLAAIVKLTNPPNTIVFDYVSTSTNTAVATTIGIK